MTEPPDSLDGLPEDPRTWTAEQAQAVLMRLRRALQGHVTPELLEQWREDNEKIRDLGRKLIALVERRERRENGDPQHQSPE